MITVTMEELLAPFGESELVTLQIAKLDQLGFQVDNWDDDYETAKIMVAAHAAATASVSRRIPQIARMFLLRWSEGPWLTVLTASDFLEERAPATFTRRKIRIVDAGAGPDDFLAETIVVKARGTGLLYRLAQDVHLDSGGYAEPEFLAFEVGAAYNADPVAWDEVTSTAGVTFEEPPGNPIVSIGTEEQGDESLRSNARGRITTKGAGMNDDAYEWHAKHVPGIPVGTITRVVVQRHTPTPSSVRVIVAGPTSSGTNGAAAVDAATIATMQDFFYPVSRRGRAPTNVKVEVQSAVVKVFPIVGTLYALASELSAGYTRAVAELNELASTYVPTSGTLELELVRTTIRKQFSASAKNRLVLTAPTADLVLSVNEIPVFDLGGLATVAVPNG